MSLIHHEKTQITLDTETGLMWQDNIDSKELKLNWIEAQEYCKNLRLGGFSDWKIPDKDVLLAIAKKAPSYVKETFKNISFDYITNTVSSNNEMQVVSFLVKDSCAKRYKNMEYHIRCVRKKKLYSVDITEISNCKIIKKDASIKKIFSLPILNLTNIFKKDSLNKDTIILSSLAKELYFFKYENKEYFGFFYEILEKINLTQIKNSANISEIINQKLEEKIKEYLNIDKIQEPNFDLIKKDSFIKDEFETQIEFDERVNQFIKKQKKEYEQREIEYKKRVENLENIKKDFLFEIFAQTMGIPVLKDAYYDAESDDMYMTLFMTNCLWEKKIKVKIQNKIIANNFKINLNNVKVDVTFDLENEEFVFDKVELEFDNNKFISEESKEQEKLEEIKIDFKLVKEEPDLETSIDNQLPKYALEVKTLDNQKLEDEIRTLKEQLRINETQNQTLSNNNQILINQNEEFENLLKVKDDEIVNLKSVMISKNNEAEEKYQNILKEKLQISEENNQNNEILKQEIKELKESKLSLENIVRIKENEISSLKNDNRIILIQIEDLKQELVSKNSELEELGKSNLKIHEITSHFGNILKIKEDEIISLKNTNEQIIKDNQVLNNQLISKNYEMEELKKYCNELQLNSSSQEEQTSSKVVERESFSDF